MGMNCLNRCLSNPYAASLQPVNSDPKPNLFNIQDEFYINGYLVLRVEYPNCTNFEGIKVMVYTGFKDSKELLNHNKGLLDPHFSEGKGSPFMRLKPQSRAAEKALRLLLSE